MVAEVGIYMRYYADLLGVGLGEDARFAGPCVIWSGREVRAAVFLAVDDLPLNTRLKLARERYGIEVKSRDDTLRRLISTSTIVDSESAWLTAAAVYAVYTTAAKQPYPEVRTLADGSPDPLVRETATWARTRLDR